MSTVKVIDAPCGAGKTTWAIQEMHNHDEREYIYCTPFLDEITRIRNACGAARFAEPKNYDCSKIDSFTELLEERSCIAVTHSTFLNATPRTIDAMSSGKYTLILDEVLDVVQQFNETHIVQGDRAQAMSKEDMELLIEEKLISVDDKGLVHWIGRSYKGGKFSEVERLSKLERLYYIRSSLLVCVFPPEVFRALDDIYVMTYRFESSMLRAYFELFGIPYELASVKKDEAGGYYVCEYDPEIDIQYRQKVSKLVTVCSSSKYNFEDAQRNKQTMFSSTWWKDRATKEICNNLSSYIRNYFKNLHATATNEAIMWTCPTKHKDKLTTNHFNHAQTLSTISEEELKLLDEDTREARFNCFVPCNMKASNNYSNRWALAYLCSLHYVPDLRGLFVDDNPKRIANGEKAIVLDDDEFALSSLIQWICRSRLRNDKPVNLYLPSKRMRRLFLGWLDTSSGEAA